MLKVGDEVYSRLCNTEDTPLPSPADQVSATLPGKMTCVRYGKFCLR